MPEKTQANGTDPVADSDSITDWIAKLASTDAPQREEAARELFRRGCAAAEPVLRTWFADAEFRALLRPGGPLTAGIAVTPPHFAEIRSRNGSPRLANAPLDQDVLEFELEFSHGVRIDILTTRDPAAGGVMARFLDRFGEGIQQVECAVSNVVRATEILGRRFALTPVVPKGHTGVLPETRQGADGTRVNFFLVPIAADQAEGDKILIELVETPARKRRK